MRPLGCRPLNFSGKGAKREMTRTKIAATALAAAVALTSVTRVFAEEPAQATEPTTQQLLDQIKQLQTKVEQLEQKQNKTNADVAATVDQILRDAEKRSQ